MPQGGLPWQVHQFAGHKEGRMKWYGLSMAGLALGTWWWWSKSEKDIMQTQDDAVARAGRHGEKVEYRRDFTPAKGDRFPGIPTTETSAAGGHSGGTKA